MRFLPLSAGILAAASPLAFADLIHRWSFNEPAGDAPPGTTMTDSVSGATATVRGGGTSSQVSSFNGAELRIHGSTNGNHTTNFMDGYVDLPNGIVSSKTHLSVEIWATPQGFPSYGRLFDFGRCDASSGPGAAPGEIIDSSTQGQTPGVRSAQDNLYWSFSVGTNGNSQRLDAIINGDTSNPDLSYDSSLATTAGVEHHYVFTFEDGVGSYGSAGGQVKWFRDGSPVYSADVDFHLADVEDVNNWLGRSQWTQDYNANASYDEVRIYDHVLSPAEIAADYSAGPDVIVSPPDPETAPVPDHLWVFNDQANSTLSPNTVFVDSIGGMIATLRGNGAALTGTALRLPGSTTGNQPASSISGYLDLPNGIVSSRSSVTFEAWATPKSSRTWQRLFDFGRCATTHGNGAAPGEILDDSSAPGATSGYDNLSLTLNNADNINSQQLEGQYDGNAPLYSFSAAATSTGVEYHYVFIIENGVGTYGASGCQARWYRNSVLQNSMDFPFLASSIEDVNNWIGRSMYSGDSNSNLDLNELRIYDRAITPGEVLASYQAGADPNSGPPETLPPVPIPENRWSFDNPAGGVASGTAFVDDSGRETATLLGNGASLSGTAVVLPGTTNGNQTAAAISAYLKLRNGLISEHPSFTIESWLTPLSSQVWQRICDFGNCTITSGTGAAEGEIIDGPAAPGGFIANDNLFLSLNNGGTLGSHRLGAKLDAGAETTLNTDLSSATSTGTEYHYVLTVEDQAGSFGGSGCRANWYRNGELVGSLDLPFRMPDMTDTNNWIGRSNWAGDMGSNLALDELRFHTRAITAKEVLSSYQEGPGATFPAPVAVADEATIHPYQKVLVDVLANDGGAPIPATLQIVSPPATGSATVENGKILYAHSGDTSAPVTFTYRAGNVSGGTADGDVTVYFNAGLRITNPDLAMPAAPPATNWQLVDALPGLSFSEPLCLSHIPGDIHQLFVCERMAKVQRVDDVTSVSPNKNVFLDLQQVVAGRSPAETIEGGGNSEHGLLGLAFHPDYANNGYFYVAYTVRVNGGSYYQRISRFHVDNSDPTVADPASELVLLQQLDEGSNHDGGDLHFGPDGYLYYCAGDEENPNDFRLNSQRVDKDFFAGIFRIDVDKKPGNLEPNPHASIPTDAGVARFSVPIDNPFVHTSLGGTWDGIYNGSAVTPLSAVRSEFWATGLRHVWRFSFDSETGDLWAGDVGQDKYEEVDKVIKGGNYGWVFREGAHDNTAAVNPGWPDKPDPFVSIDPVYEYVHTAIAGGDAAYKGNSVCGGYVYRGTRFPALAGSYIFCDSVSGHVWQMDTNTGATTRIAGLPGQYGVFSAEGVDPYNKDILFCAYLTGRIMRLTSGDASNDGFPKTLTDTRLFADLTDLSPSPGLLPYQPNLRFWSDYADKTRWFAIPDATSRMTWAREGQWTYPTGMIWVKHFDLEMSRDNPATKKRIETRVLVKTDTGAYGVSYRWNDAGTEAYLVGEAGDEFDLQIDDHGTPHTQHWQIPGRSSCLTCHGDRPLSFVTRQLNRSNTIHGFTGNQIDLLADGGFFDNTPDAVENLPYHVRPDETQYPLEQRARSYFDVNCAYCHQAGGSVGQFWDGRAQLKLEQTGLLNGVAENNGGNPANKYIVPGDSVHSIVLNRMAATNGFTRMPPLATAEFDEANIQLITDWINSELPGRTLYDQWRDSYFVSVDPNGDKSADPDGDGVSNYEEYLRGTSPLNGTNPWQATITDGMLSFNRMAHRYYAIETSEDLIHWQPWSIPEIDSIYQTEDSEVDLPLPAAPDGRMFFRYNVTEP